MSCFYADMTCDNCQWMYQCQWRRKKIRCPPKYTFLWNINVTPYMYTAVQPISFVGSYLAILIASIQVLHSDTVSALSSYWRWFSLLYMIPKHNWHFTGLNQISFVKRHLKLTDFSSLSLVIFAPFVAAGPPWELLGAVVRSLSQ